ncbi:MAG: PLDc N-terminal domain-containing protein [Microthrixaceae bacterium]
MASDKRSWSDLSTRSKVLIVISSVLELVVTSAALNDLRKRPPALVRGPKLLWSAVCFVQPVGPIIYLLWGRRDGQL